MALQVWLPLIGDAHNQGEYPVDFASSNTSVSANGCIGSCYSFNGSNSYMNAPDPNKNFWANKGITESVWFKSDKTQTGGTLLELFADLTIGYSYNSSGIRFNYWRSYTNSSGNRAGDSQTCSTYFSADVWHHIAVTFELGINKMYVDGQLIQTWDRSSVYTANWKPLLGTSYNNIAVGRSYGSTSFIGGQVNDVRFYDHCLSAKEIKEISKGLIIHYKLENHNLKNIVNYPTFNTSSANGGWNHWGSSGGSYSQNTDKTFIYDKNKTYSHRVTNNLSDVYNYLLYQSPAYDTTIASGGLRTMVAIIKDASGRTITDDICYPVVNSYIASSSVTASGKWTNISGLGDGFYLCKFEGVYQRGDNNLIGIYVKPFCTVYVSEMYVENYSSYCGYFGNYANSTDVMEDSSGYGRHGVHNSGTVVSVKSTTGRYTACMENLSGYMGRAEVNIPSLDNITISWWGNYKEHGVQTSGLFATSDLDPYPTDYTATAGNMRDNRIDICNVSGTYKGLTTNGLELNKWQHYCMTYNGTTAIWYIDGVQKATVEQTGALKPFKYVYLGFSKAGGVTRMCKGKMSDFRIYCTALSANDVKELYETSASVDNKGRLHCYELREV